MDSRNSEQAEGTVLGQDPEAGVSVEVGSTVNIKVSNGKVKVPDVVGKNQAQAQADLSQAGFQSSVDPLETSSRPRGHGARPVAAGRYARGEGHGRDHHGRGGATAAAADVGTTDLAERATAVSERGGRRGRVATGLGTNGSAPVGTALRHLSGAGSP